MFLHGTSFSSPARLKRLARYSAFVLGAMLIWAGYFAWRPPAPMLGLRHVAHMGNEPTISMTFDDAPHPLSTPLLLAALRRTDAKATFFIVGDSLRLYPELAHRIASEGHAMANHSHYHHNLTGLSPDEYDREVEGCFQAIEREGQGQPWAQTRLFRPPGGGLNRSAMDYLYRQNAVLALWSHNTGDWTCPPAWKIAQGVKQSLKPGDIILLHDGGTGTPQAIPEIVREARKRGFSFAPMPE